MTPFLISTPQLQLIVNTLYNIFEETTSYSLLFLCQASRINKRVSSNMLEKACAHFTFKICALPNPPSPNERLSKGYRIGDIKASAHASHKTHACISLKQRSYSRNYGLVCNLGKQMAVSV